MLRKVLLYLLCAIVISPAIGQSIRGLPATTPSTNYQHGSVWVKLKSEHKDIFTSRSAGRADKLGLRAAMPFVHEGSARTNARVGPLQQHVDISKYYTLNFDPSRSIEELMAMLKATGYFEVVEPVYTITPFHTPNDPSIIQQAYLDIIKAREAWDITKGDPAIVIGVVDTGGDLDHPDLQGKLAINSADPVDGLDNDGDGFIDNNRGWDFSGADIALIGTAGFKGDNDPSISKANLFSHGTMVAGCAAASTNNGIGISAVGYNTKLLFTKHFADNQPDTGSGYSSDLYAGILYAATHGARIINCSWGSYNRSAIAQDIITYVTLDLGCLVIAASGNSNLENPMYPASYDYVLSVASSNGGDVRSFFSNFGNRVDIIAPGEGIYTSTFNNSYITESGTSLAAPIVSGAAALVWTKFPDYTPLQVAEQLRVTADPSIYSKNPNYLNKLGRGRLNVLSALTKNGPSVRASNQQVVNANNTSPEPGQRCRLFFDFTNYLRPSSAALKATISSTSPYITMLSNGVNLGSMGSNYTMRNTDSPFEFQLSPSLPIDEKIEILITFSDGMYDDFQLVSIVIPSFLDINENNITTSLTAAGKIGFGNTETQSNGSGFIYGDENLVYEMGLIMGTSGSLLYSSVRGTGGQFDQDFTASSQIVKNTPGQRSYSEITGSFINGPNLASATLSTTFRSLVWKNDPYKDLIILEYQIKNITNTVMTDFFMGIFADWDIVNHGAGDRAGWDAATKLGYVYAATPGPYALTAIQLLTGNPQYYAIDNDQAITGNPFGIYDGFTDLEKFTSISTGVARLQAGNPVNGNDVSHVVGGGPYTIAAGQTLTVAFALHASTSKTGLINSAHQADSLYNYTLKAPVPIVQPVEICATKNAVLHASNAGKFKWYKEFTGGSAFFEGPTLTTGTLDKDTTVFVSNADKSYESLRLPVHITVRPNPMIDVSGDAAFCAGGATFLSTQPADEVTWSNGSKTLSMQPEVTGEYTVVARNGTLSCTSLDPVLITVYDRPTAAFIISPDVPSLDQPISFFAEEELEVSWLWDFGDGSTSDARNPVHTYIMQGNYLVSLRVTNAFDCVGTQSKSLGPVTAIEPLQSDLAIYPNPVSVEKIFIDMSGSTGPTRIELIDPLGATVLETVSEEAVPFALDLSHFHNGVYTLRLTTGKSVTTRKVVIAR